MTSIMTLTDTILDHMVRNPLLVERPIVCGPGGVRLCRPSDMVIELLLQRLAGEIRKEDGTPLLVDRPIAGSGTGLTTALQEAGLPADDLTEPGRSFFAYATVTDERVGYGGFEHMGRDVLVRSLVVLPHARQRGIGGGILALLLRRAFDDGGRDAWLLTTTAALFFKRAGFKPVERSAAPAAILATRQAANLCPSSAALLGRSITL